MAPFAAHPDYQYSLEYMDKELKAVGEVANRLGVRLTTHPGAPSPPYPATASRDHYVSASESA